MQTIFYEKNNIILPGEYEKIIHYFIERIIKKIKEEK